MRSPQAAYVGAVERAAAAAAADARDAELLDIGGSSCTATADAAPRYEVRVSCDPAARTLTVEDTGIGMSKAELATYLGTLGCSRTRELSEVR